MAKTNPNHKLFFETFFKGKKGYQEVQVNDWWLIQHWDGNKQAFTIDVYSPESYRNYLRGKSLFKEQQQQMDFLRRHLAVV